MKHDSKSLYEHHSLLLSSTSLTLPPCLKVNAPYLANAMTPSTHPWLQLGTKLGMLAAGLAGVRPHKVGVRVCGEVVQGYGDFIVPAVLVGALGGCGVNLVNAQKRAKELGISVSKERKGGR